MKIQQVDPLETIRSADILFVFPKYFTILIQRDYCGKLLNIFLANIVGNFDENKEHDRIILQHLCYIESILIREKVLTSDFTIIVALAKKHTWFDSFSR